jgi:hypothetical protein
MANDTAKITVNFRSLLANSFITTFSVIALAPHNAEFSGGF